MVCYMYKYGFKNYLLYVIDFLKCFVFIRNYDKLGCKI